MNRPAEIGAARLWIVLTRCEHAVSQLVERSVAGSGLCPSDFAALEALLHKGPLTITEIQAKVLLASGSMTAAVDRLEQKGLIRRTTTQNDRRARVLELTPAGGRLIESVYNTHAQDLEDAAAALSGPERRRLHALLKKWGLFAAQKIKEREAAAG